MCRRGREHHSRRGIQIGMYRVSDSSALAHIEWYYTGGAVNGTMKFTTPSTIGDYDFRYYLADSENQVDVGYHHISVQ